MPKFPRLIVPGLPHHVTQRGVRRQTTFFDDSDYRSYLDLAKALLPDYSIDIWAYCLMPNHIHAIIVPHDDGSLSRFLAMVHRRYARRTNLKYDWSGHLWQKRFHSVVMDELHTYAALRYVELNPVRSGICRDPAEWPWSSARGNLEISIDPLIDRANTRPLVTNWAEYLAEPEDPSLVSRLRKQTGTGRPSGSEEFLSRLESTTGRRIKTVRAGRRRNQYGVRYL